MGQRKFFGCYFMYLLPSVLGNIRTFEPMLKKLIAKKYLPLLLTIFIGLALLLFYLGDVIPRLNTVYFNSTGDGIKNYYTAEYHAKYDKDLFHFNGMNYPEGEHVMFTDGFFPVVAVIKVLKPIVDLSDYTHGIINGIILLSFIVAVFFLFRIFQELKINEWAAAVAAPLLVFMSPQVMRIPGHYSLALLFFIPLMIYLILKYYQRQRWKYIIWAGVAVLLCSLCHLYYFAMAGILTGGVVLYLILFDRKNISVLQSLKFLFFAVILPYILIFLMMKITDSVDDRSAYPYGFMVYKTQWEGLFLPKGTVSWPWLKSFLKPDFVLWEGWSYIGHAGLIGYIFTFSLFAALPFLLDIHLAAFFTVLVAGLIIFIFLKRRKKLYDLSGNPFMNALLWSGFIAMFVSFAFPINVFPDLYYYIGPVRELRGIGRMAWILFYSVNIGLFFIVENQLRKRWLKITAFVVLIVVMGYDMHKQNKEFLFSLGESNSIAEMQADIDQIPLQTDALSNRYQAILTIPSFLVGSENVYSDPDNEDVLGYALLLSQKSGLPLVSSLMSRTSISQTLQKLAFFYGPYNRPDEFLKSIDHSKDFLILSTPATRQLFRGEELIMQHCDTLYKHARFYICSIHPDTLKKWYAFTSVNKNQTSAGSPLLWHDYSENASGQGYFTKGTSAKFSLKDPVIAIELPLPSPVDSAMETEISFWYSDIHEDGLMRGSCEIVFLDHAGNVVAYDLGSLFKSMQQTDGNWGLYQRRMTVPPGAVMLRVSLIHYELQINSITIDNILLRSVSGDIVIQGNSWFMKNNYFYKKIK